MILDAEILGKQSYKWLRFLGGIIFIALITILLTLVYIPQVVKFSGMQASEFLSFESARALFFILLSLPLAVLPLWFWLRVVHKRSLSSLISPAGNGFKASIKMAVIYFALYYFLMELSTVLSPQLGLTIEYLWQPELWLFWIIPIAVATFLQTSAEEIVFRGYFQQYLAALIPVKWVYYLIPTLVWASLHYGNVEGYYTNLAAVFSVFVLGIIFADWVDRTKSLWGPMIVHFLNNFSVLCFFGNSLEKSDLHILRVNYDALSDPAIALLALLGSGIMALSYLFLRRRI